MRILVTHASKHGATAGIAQRIGDNLRSAGHRVDVCAVGDVDDVASYDAFVVGSALYLGRWMRSASSFVRGAQEVLATRPVWLFSSGPLGDEVVDEHGADLRTVTRPRELLDLQEAVRPRDHRVFFGALDPSRLTFAERSMRRLPAGRALMPEGDFRDWSDVDEWTAEIGQALA
ncbi:flavodoxin domain-containing protein [Nocardioides sp.]|uniref:flavodoxin domain-containing protein n=1 Tax=Nocardioides sp. TaxID=35761 RepID=UPI003D0A9B89